MYPLLHRRGRFDDDHRSHIEPCAVIMLRNILDSVRKEDVSRCSLHVHVLYVYMYSMCEKIVLRFHFCLCFCVYCFYLLVAKRWQVKNDNCNLENNKHKQHVYCYSTAQR